MMLLQHQAIPPGGHPLPAAPCGVCR